MDSFSSSKFSTSRGLTYGYVHLAPAQGDRGKHILFLHGFPSSSYDWRYQIAYFRQRGYGIIVPDLLGYVSDREDVSFILTAEDFPPKQSTSNNC
jgi:soluble epoxide hydrolase / lipid-phosphate phosphatase